MTSSNKDIASAEKFAKNSNDLNKERREALRRLGRFGAYTAPALLAMLTSEAAAQVSDGA